MRVKSVNMRAEPQNACAGADAVARVVSHGVDTTTIMRRGARA